MSNEEATQLRVLDEKERIAWQEYAANGTSTALSIVMECAQEKAKVMGLDTPKSRRERI